MRHFGANKINTRVNKIAQDPSVKLARVLCYAYCMPDGDLKLLKSNLFGNNVIFSIVKDTLFVKSLVY